MSSFGEGLSVGLVIGIFVSTAIDMIVLPSNSEQIESCMKFGVLKLGDTYLSCGPYEKAGSAGGLSGDGK